MSHDWKDAYEAQFGTWKWCRSDVGSEWRHDHWQLSMQDLHPPTQGLLTSLYALEEDKLLVADPYYVSPEMGEVISAASASFAPEPLLATDLLTETGFCYFAEPITMPDKYTTMIALHAFSWAPIVTEEDTDREKFERHVSGLEDLAAGEIGVRYSLKTTPNQIGVALTLYAEPKREKWDDAWGAPPPALPIHHTPWYFGMDFEGNEFDSEGVETGVERWWQVCQTTLRLMQQRLAHREHTKPDRATRRRGEAKGFRQREVVVVRLRREAGDHVPHESGEASYSHRFIVSGHWRQQWYPSINGHRQIWISPYVKGPEDQPLVVRPRRVFNVVR